MTTYERRHTIEAKLWDANVRIEWQNGPNDRPQQAAKVRADIIERRAKEIVFWIASLGGEALYNPPTEAGTDGITPAHEGRIVVRAKGGWAFAYPGDYLVMGTEMLEDTNKPWSTGPHMIRPFSTLSPEEFEAEGWTKK